MDISKLGEPFPPNSISWRVGATNKNKDKGIALAYIDARDVMDRLDSVVGAGNWQDDYTETASGRVICRLSILIDNQWVTKSDGAGATDYEGEKGAISDAFKRAAVKWGIGRYLYALDAPWVKIEARGRSYSIAPGEKHRLSKMIDAPAPKPTPQPTAGTKPQNEQPKTYALSKYLEGYNQGRKYKVSTFLDVAEIAPLYNHGRHVMNALNMRDDIKAFNAKATANNEPQFGLDTEIGNAEKFAQLANYLINRKEQG